MASILVVDDEPDIVRMVSRVLAQRGHGVTTARSAEDALDAMQSGEQRPELVIVDLDLPEMNGLELCKRIKASDHAVPVVMMTAAYVSLSDATNASNVGADEYLVKPFLEELLVHNVERLLSD